MVVLDVVIIGGGIQGLVLLRELSAAGYACALVTNADLGSGQTLHSHGLVNSGAGLLTGALTKELHGSTLPYLRRLGVPVYGEDRSFLVAPDHVLDHLGPIWEAHGYHPQPTDASVLPHGFEPRAPLYRLQGFNVDKRRLVKALRDGLEGLVLRGEVVNASNGIDVRPMPSGEVVSLDPRAVVIAAGCGTKRLLRDVFGVGEGTLSRISYTRIHMICLRGPADILPEVGTVLSPELMVVGHPRREGLGTPGGVISWYVTPADPAPVAHAEAPDNAAAEVDGQVVRLAIEALGRLFSPLAADEQRVEAAVFAGYKQDWDGQPTARACEVLDQERNIVLALPSVLANAVPNAVDAVDIVRQRVDATAPRLEPWGGGVAVGELTEHTNQAAWRSWGAFAHAYGARIS